MASLPPANDPVGITIRLLLSESLTPSASNYDAAEVLGGMQEMRATIDNRLTSPRDFCAAGATDAVGIITAVCPGGGQQFAGYTLVDGSVVVAPPQQSCIDAILERADTDPDYQTFLDNAIQTANNPVTSRFADLTDIGGTAVKPGPYGWRTAGHGGPAGRMIAIPADQGGIIAGNQFFALKA